MSEPLQAKCHDEVGGPEIVVTYTQLCVAPCAYRVISYCHLDDQFNLNFFSQRAVTRPVDVRQFSGT